MTMTEQSTAPAVTSFLSVLLLRDLSGVGTCLTEDVRFRALVPPGPFELTGPAAVTACFERWFGGEDDYELLDSSSHPMGGCHHLSWLIRMRNDAGRCQLVEQDAFARIEGGDSGPGLSDGRIRSLDLLCSGWQDEIRPG